MNVVPLRDVHEESYLERIICEFTSVFDTLSTERRMDVSVPYCSECEDWNQSMFMAGLGICFMPQFLPALPGLQTRPLFDPEIAHEIELVTVADREYSPAARAFVAAVLAHDWSTSRSTLPQAFAL